MEHVPPRYLSHAARGTTVSGPYSSNTAHGRGDPTKEPKNTPEPGERGRRGGDEAFRTGRLLLFALVAIVLGIVLLQLLDLL